MTENIDLAVQIARLEILVDEMMSSMVSALMLAPKDGPAYKILDEAIASTRQAWQRSNTRAPLIRQISEAPKDRVILVEDRERTAEDQPCWVAARWIDCKPSPGNDGWAGWIYDDPLLADADPLGPRPLFWLDAPPPPKHLSESD